MGELHGWGFPCWIVADAGAPALRPADRSSAFAPRPAAMPSLASVAFGRTWIILLLKTFLKTFLYAYRTKIPMSSASRRRSW